MCHIDRDAQGCQGMDRKANAWTETYRRTRHTGSAETLVTVMANLRWNDAALRGMTGGMITV